MQLGDLDTTYLSGSISLSSHAHLKILMKYYADVSRKEFYPLCREPGNQNPESTLVSKHLVSIYFVSDAGLHSSENAKGTRQLP